MEWNISLWKFHAVMGLSMGTSIWSGSAPREPKKSAIVEQFIDGKNYVFDSDGCAKGI